MPKEPIELLNVIVLYPQYTDNIGNKERVEFPPLGMLSICAVIQQLGHSVEVISISSDTNIERLPHADVYLYSITATVTFPYFKRLFPNIRNKAKIHAAGGAHVNVFPIDTLNTLNIEAVFVGESETTIKEWFENGLIHRGVIASKYVDINAISFPARKLLDDNLIYLNKRVAGNHDNIISMVSSRGCTYKCKFCAVPNRGYVHFKSANNFDKELASIQEDYPKCEGIVLLDETFTFSEDHAIGIASVLKDHRLIWECNSRADKLTDKVIMHLANSLCKEVRIGIETGSQALLNSMKKGIKLEDVKEVLKKCYQAGLPVKGYFMHGYPGENEITTMATIDFLEEMKPYLNRISVYQFSPLPGSPIFNELHIDDNTDFKKFSIYNNYYHWWGTKENHIELINSYNILCDYVKKEFNKTKEGK